MRLATRIPGVSNRLPDDWSPSRACAAALGVSSGSLILEDRRGEMQAWSTGKEAHIVVVPLKFHRYRAPSFSPLPSSLSVAWPRWPPGPARCLPPKHTWVHILQKTSSRGYLTIRRSRPCHPAEARLVPARADRRCLPPRVQAFGARHCE